MERLGFHYYPDTNHYRQSDLKKWLPELINLGASWLVINAPYKRAIPEFFIKGLINSGINPILQYNMKIDQSINTDDFNVILNAYAKWGVKNIIFFNRPNMQASWSPSLWLKYDPVDKFLDIFAPLAKQLISHKITPFFPPLEPGGDYWDTAFLRSALQGLSCRGEKDILDKLVITCYSSPRSKPLNWGAGGQERWPDSRPYSKSAKGQDHFGFRIFDWYITIVKAVLLKTKPVFLLGLNGEGYRKQSNPYLDIAKLLAYEELKDVDPLPNEIIGGAFELPQFNKNQGVYSKDISTVNEEKIIKSIKEWIIKRDRSSSKEPISTFRIKHYLLLPTYDWGIADWHLDVIRPYVKKYKPTIGYSLIEASHAQRVTVIGGNQLFPEEELRKLRNNGVVVERIEGDGTEIATVLAKH